MIADRLRASIFKKSLVEQICDAAGLDYSTYSTLDLLAGSDTSMAAIAGSETAMELVFGDLEARSVILASAYVSNIWTNANSAEVFYAGTPSLPHTYYSASEHTVLSYIIDGYTSAGKGIEIKNNGGLRKGTFSWYMTFDLTDISTLKLYAYHARTFGTVSFIKIYIGGTEVYSTGDAFAWTLKSFDVSSLSGEKSLQLSLYNKDTYAGSYYNTVGMCNIVLEE